MNLFGFAHLVQADVDFGIARAKGQQQLRDVVKNCRAENTDVEQTDFAIVDQARAVFGFVYQHHDFLRFFEEGFAGNGQRDAFVIAQEELHAQVFFQLLNLPRQRRLGDEQPFGGARKIQLLRQHQKILDLPEFQHGFVSLIAMSPLCGGWLAST